MSAAHATPRHLHNVAASRWKNGTGTTRELLKIATPGSADGFLCRVSIANVDSDAAFSIYPGIDRILAILKGSGMEIIDTLRGTVLQALPRHYSMAMFAGEQKLAGRLLDGPILDFNVMVRRDAATAALRVVEGSRIAPLQKCCFVFVAKGHARIAFDDGSTLLISESEFTELDCAEHIATGSASVALLVDLWS